MTAVYQRPSAPVADRLADLMGRMTVDEKIAQLHAFWLILSPNGNHTVRADKFTGSTDPDVMRDMLRFGLGQITRPLGSRSIEPRLGVRALNSLQKFMCEDTRLGIPVMAHEECLSGLMINGATLFPTPLALGASWNPDLVREMARHIGIEARSVGCRQGLAPVLDVGRDARWGRTEEVFGEDPYLVGVMGAAYVDGLQGPERDLLATLKHFAGHSASEGARNHAPVNLGMRELSDTFLLPFEMAVKLARAGSVMPAYHDIDGEPCHSSRFLLTEILRDTWGFDGLVVADYIGVNLLYKDHRVAADAADAAAKAFGAGLDIELPAGDCSMYLRSALERGSIDIQTIDAIVSRVLEVKFRTGLFEAPYANEEKICLQSVDAIDVARRVAREGIVVMANSGILPLTGQPKIAVIGPTADDPMALLGGYSFPVHQIIKDEFGSLQQVVTPRAGLEARFGAANVVYAKGCHILEQRAFGNPVFPGDVSDNASVDTPSRVSTSLELIPQAVAAARAADVAIVCIGDLAGLFQTGTVGEGSDADSLALPGVQYDLLHAILDTGKPVIVVLTAGRPYSLGALEDRVSACVSAFFGGQEAGNALADILSGDHEPTGRLTVSVPRTAGAVPYFYNHKFKSAGTPIARHFGSRYPFGAGLAYTEFAFDDLALTETTVPAEGGTIHVEFVVRNTGKRRGTAVPQLYVRDLLASVARPVRELKGFGRIALEAGTSTRVRFELPTDMLNLTDANGRRVVEPGRFEIQIGASSQDIRLSTVVEVTGDVRILPANWRMLSHFSIAN